MVSRAYAKCKRVLKELIKAYGPTARVSARIVERTIKNTVGYDPRTVKNCLQAMIDFNMLILPQDDKEVQNRMFGFNCEKLDDPEQPTSLKDYALAKLME
jgi:hypothetical protein